MTASFRALRPNGIVPTITLSLFVCVAWVSANAAIVTVSSTNDAGAGSLRQAIVSASAGDTIEFSVAGTITLTSGELAIDKDLTLAGPGATNLVINGAGASRLFSVASGVAASISGLTLADGLAVNGEGGGILNAGTLRLSQCTITNCVARAPDCEDALGGGILNWFDSTLTVVDCLFVGNRALGGRGASTNECNGGNAQGGAICGLYTTLSVTNSTFSANHAQGGSLFAEGMAFRVGSGLGGAVLCYSGDSTLINCTIVSNAVSVPFGTNVASARAMGGGAYYSDYEGPGVMRLKNTLISGNGATLGLQASTNLDVGGEFISLGHNLVGNADTATGLTNGVSGDQVGTGGSPIDPRMGPLADNGGPTFTHALLPGSPAINAGDNAGITATDQRGLPRWVRAAVDIGAFEVQDLNTPPVADSQTAIGLEDTDLLITLTGSDADTNALTASVTSLPGIGALYQYSSGTRGPAITSVPAAVTDVQWRLIFVPPADANGSPFTMFDFLVNDGSVDSAPAPVTVNVIPVNDPPSFTKGADQTVNEDAGPQTVTGWATAISPGPPDETGQQWTFYLTNDNVALFSAQPAVSPGGTLSYTPAPNANGSALVTVWLQDDGGTANGGLDTSATQTFLITVNPVNDPPSFVKGPDQMVNEDSGGHMVLGWATAVSPGPPDEALQVLMFTTTNDNSALFAVQPAIGDGVLQFVPAPDAFGQATVTAVLQDNGGTANGGVDTSLPVTFTITVRPVNDPPSFVRGPDQWVNQNAGAQSVPGWATGLSIGPVNEAGQALDFIVSNDNAPLFSTPPAVASTGTLTYTPAPNANGVATVTVRAHDDGGTLYGGIDTSAPQTFAITVNAPPVVQVIDPTNGTVFVAPATFPVVAEAGDPDGWVTNTRVFAEASLLGEAPTNVCFAVWSNVLAGTYSLSARATDNLGLSADSTIVTITVLEGPPVGPLGPLVLNRQTGLFEQTVRVTNPSPLPIAAVQLTITNALPLGVCLWNASGTNSGQPYVQHDPPVAARGWVDFHLEYYLTNRPSVTNLTDAFGIFNPGYLARLVPPSIPPAPAVTNALQVEPIPLTNGNFLVEFSTDASRFYYLQYSADLTNWKTAVPVAIGNGSRVQWIDSGPPKTESPPSSVPARFYRVILLP